MLGFDTSLEYIVSINIPFNRKDEAKFKGFKWDSVSKKWFKKIQPFLDNEFGDIISKPFVEEIHIYGFEIHSVIPFKDYYGKCGNEETIQKLINLLKAGNKEYLIQEAKHRIKTEELARNTNISIRNGTGLDDY